ncbi:MAG: hypothetical protein ACYCO4_06230 [Sulfobacillus sp.]
MRIRVPGVEWFTLNQAGRWDAARAILHHPRWGPLHWVAAAFPADRSPDQWLETTWSSGIWRLSAPWRKQLFAGRAQGAERELLDPSKVTW